MVAEPLRDLSASDSEGRKDHIPGEEAIQACYDLLSSGRALSDILVALKRLGPLNRHNGSERRVEPSDTEIPEITGEDCAASSQWRTVQLAQPVESRRLDQSREPSGALVCAGGDLSPYHTSRSLVALTAPSSRRVENGLRDKLFRPIGAVLLWLIPAISLTSLGSPVDA